MAWKAPPWSNERTLQLGRLINKGLSVSEVAAEMAITCGMASGRAHRLGWGFGHRLSEAQLKPPFKIIQGVPDKPTRIKPVKSPHDAKLGVHARLDQETFGQVGAYAETHGVSMAQAMRELVEWGLEALGECA